MKLLHHRQGLPGRVCDHVRVREPIFLELAIEDLNLKLERGSVSRAPDDRLLSPDTRGAQSRVTESGEVVPTKHVPELVLVAKLLIPISVKEKMRRPFA